MWLWRVSDHIFSKILLNDSLRALSLCDDDFDKATLYRDKQKLKYRCVFTNGSQQEKVCRRMLALRHISLQTELISSSSFKTKTEEKMF